MNRAFLEVDYPEAGVFSNESGYEGNEDVGSCLCYFPGDIFPGR